METKPKFWTKSKHKIMKFKNENIQITFISLRLKFYVKKLIVINKNIAII